MSSDPRSWGQSVSIRTKLIAAFGVVFAVVVALGLLGLTQLHVGNHATMRIADVLWPQVEALQSIKRLAHEHRLLATRRTQSTTVQDMAAASSMKETESALDEAKRSYLSTLEVDEERQLFSAFQSHWRNYTGTLPVVQNQLEIGELSAASQTFNETALKHFESANKVLDRMIAASKQRADRASAEVRLILDRAIWMTAAGILLAAGCVLATVNWVSRSVISPMLEVSDAMRKLSGGDRTIPVPLPVRRKDEIGALIEAVAGYSQALTQSRQLVNAVEVQRERLQAAISNMPAGLSMFDKDQRLIVCNDAFAEMFKLPPDLLKPGTPSESIFCNGIGIDDTQSQLPGIGPKIAEAAAVRKRLFDMLELSDGRIVSISIQPIADGGWVGVYEDVTERRRNEERIRYMAHHDALTDLPNRLQFEEKLILALDSLEEGQMLAVMCLDLDRFKTVNDTLGHPVGDKLLRAVAERLKGCVREHDVAARFGGDEFAVVQMGGRVPESVTATARRIIDGLSAPYVIDGHQIVIGTSIGIALALLTAAGRKPC
ncbi:MAG: diguanylate cyclase [Rhodomicrobium sp.]|nr:diguanylate cyclase [Rhodomicrobium sp.]